MNNSIKIILKKLDDIENRIKALEVKEKQQNLTNITKNQRDPLFSKAVEIIDQYEEISAQKLAEELKIEVSRAEVIMDQMEETGLGACYFKEV